MTMLHYETLLEAHILWSYLLLLEKKQAKNYTWDHHLIQLLKGHIQI